MEDDGGSIVVIALCCWLVCAAFGSYIASAKGRGSTEGFLFGFILGPLGLILAACLPTVQARQVATLAPPAPPPLPLFPAQPWKPKPRKLMGEVTE